MKKKVTILGSTGSIGVNALNVINNLEIDIVGLSANTNSQLLIEQAKKFQPESVSIVDEDAYLIVKDALKNTSIDVLCGKNGLLEISSRGDVDLVLNAIVGSSGMLPTVYAIRAGADIALSNKESLVMAGKIIERERKKANVNILPVDSEHSAIWQCLAGESKDEVKRLILTGSGGPFREKKISKFKDIKPEDALKHPNWEMGKKITIDSASMMNKGLEVVEAVWLFEMDPQKVDIVVHPQSIIHSMVEFDDTSVKAQLGLPDMKIPIQYALSYPNHIKTNWEPLDLVKIKSLTFESVNYERFPCIKLAYESLARGGTSSSVLNVANEQAVYRFLKKEIGFMEIPKLIEIAMENHDWTEDPSIDDILSLEDWTTNFVKSFSSKYIK
jgi:1-deoxy-D-xylulose-5-phosphate reductoisomerase|tara:strand:+ start:449 stop:1606 length:1158 start_codon:yes stop_codon:yes gene_type:complete